MRQIELTGRLAADAERKISKTGKEFLSFRVGSNEFNDKDEQGNQKTYWFNVTTFNQRHFGMAQYLTKGKSIIVEGDYSDRLYQNREGNCEIARDIMANAIYFNSDGNSNNNSNGKQTKATTQTSPVTQTTMATKPTTADVKVPEAPVVSTSNDDEDDLPF
jgi:single-strand DNA-binding protein